MTVTWWKLPLYLVLLPFAVAILAILGAGHLLDELLDMLTERS